MMDIDSLSTRASSEMDITQIISISDDDDNDLKKERIKKETEKKIS